MLKDGHLIFSFCDQYSLFSEKIRGYIGNIVLLMEAEAKLNYLDKKTKILAKIFNSHIKTLKTDTKY